MKKVEAHEIVAELHRLASELGKTPTRDDWVKLSRLSKNRVTEAFGSFSVALAAAGFDRKPPKPEKKKDIFLKPVPERTIPETPKLEPRAISRRDAGKPRTILVLGDLHFPWVNVDALSAVYAYADSHPEIDTIVQVGDLYDLFAWSRFSRSLSATYSPQEEIDRGREMAEGMWKKLRELLPHAECWQILGNHDVRPIKKCIDLAPELEPFLTFKHLFQFDGVNLIEDVRQPLELGGVYFIHGWMSKPGDHARKYLRSIVCGHTHRGSLTVIPMADGSVITELNVGYLADAHSKPLSYTPTKMNEWTLGFGVIDEWGPRFIPLGERLQWPR